MVCKLVSNPMYVDSVPPMKLPLIDREVTDPSVVPEPQLAPGHAYEYVVVEACAHGSDADH